MYKATLLTIFVVSLFSCNNGEGKQQLNSNFNSGFTANAHRNMGVILTDTLYIYDKNKKVIGKAINMLGQIIEIDSISAKKIALVNSTDRCDLHNFIKVKGLKIKGWVYGQHIFELEKSKRDTSFVSNGVRFNFIPGKNFGIGFYDEEMDEMSFCGQGTQSPLLVYNSKFDKHEYIPVDNKEVYSENYVTLDNHDGWTDEIKKLRFSNDTLNVEIERAFQEGFADINLEIVINSKQSHGIVTKYGKRE